MVYKRIARPRFFDASSQRQNGLVAPYCPEDNEVWSDDAPYQDACMNHPRRVLIHRITLNGGIEKVKGLNFEVVLFQHLGKLLLKILTG